MDEATTKRTGTVQVGRHRIEANVFGEGTPAIVIEPSFGGIAAEWQPVAEALAKDTTVITYDRVPYGASSRAHDRRSPGDITADLQAVLRELAVPDPVILAGHSVQRGTGSPPQRPHRHSPRVAGRIQFGTKLGFP